jgi:hypothetical protein
MANVVIDDSSLYAIGDALRGKLGETRMESVLVETIHHPEVSGDMAPKIAKTSNATGFDTFNGAYSNNLDETTIITVDGATHLKVVFAYQTESTTYDYLMINDTDTKYGNSTLTKTEKIFSNTNQVQFLFHSDSSNGNYLGYYAEVYGLDADGNVLQENIPAWDEEIYEEMEVANTFKPVEMASAIDTLGGGGAADIAIVDSPVRTAGSSSYRVTSYLSPCTEVNSMTLLIELRTIGDFSSRTVTGINSSSIKAYSGSYSNLVLIPYNAITGTNPSVATSSTTANYTYSTHAVINIRNIDVSSAVVKTFSTTIASGNATITFNSGYEDYKKVVIFTEGGFIYNNTGFANSDYFYPVEENSGFERLPSTVNAHAYSATYFMYVGAVAWTQTAETTLDTVTVEVADSSSVGTTLRGYVLYYKTPEEA